MMINVPVYTDENGYKLICIYVEEDEGTFKRTQNEPLRMLRNDIKGISIVQGELVSSKYDRYSREWRTPTVTYHYGKPQSFYYFIREKLARNKFFVFSKPTLSGHISKFTLHELQLKNSISQRKISILKEKYCEALALWSEEEYEANVKMANTRTVVYKDNRRIFEQADAVATEKTVVAPATVELYSVSEAEIQAEMTPTNDVSVKQADRRNLIKTFSLDRDQNQQDDEEKARRSNSTDHFYQRFVIDLD